MENNKEKDNTLKKTARHAGFLYLIVAITGLFSFFVNKKLIVSGDATTTANNILAPVSLFNLSIVSELIMATCWILTALALYQLFKSVNKNHAILMVSLVLVGSAITFVNVINKITAMLILNGSGYLTVFEINQLQALAMLFIDLSQNGVFICYIFFGLWLFPLGLLVLRSGYFPKIVGRIMGVLLIIAGAGYLIKFFTFFFFLNFNSAITSYTFFGELFLLLWLLIKGVTIPKTES